MFRLYLVRHGLTVWNHEGRLQGHTDVPLSAEGVRQAHSVARRLADVPVCAVWSSDMARARVTAEVIGAPHKLAVTTTDRLRETMLGEWEGLTRDEIIARGDEEQFRAYRLDPLQHRPPGSEQLDSVWARLTAVRRQIEEAHPDGTVVVVGHGGSLRAILCEALNAPVGSMQRIWLDNASLSMVERDAGRTWVRLVNDTSHLHDLRTGEG